MCFRLGSLKLYTKLWLVCKKRAIWMKWNEDLVGTLNVRCFIVHQTIFFVNIQWKISVCKIMLVLLFTKLVQVLKYTELATEMTVSEIRHLCYHTGVRLSVNCQCKWNCMWVLCFIVNQILYIFHFQWTSVVMNIYVYCCILTNNQMM